jgi:hypothetical protein
MEYGYFQSFFLYQNLLEPLLLLVIEPLISHAIKGAIS